MLRLRVQPTKPGPGFTTAYSVSLEVQIWKTTLSGIASNREAKFSTSGCYPLAKLAVDSGAQDIKGESQFNIHFQVLTTWQLSREDANDNGSSQDQ